MEWMVILLITALSLIRFEQGLNFDIHNFYLSSLSKNKWFLIKGVLATIVLVPIVFLFIIIVFKLPIPISYALIIMAVSPASFLSLRQVQFLGGDASLGASVQVIAALMSMLTAPLLLELYAIILGLEVNAALFNIIKQIAVAQFIPMAAGIFLRKVFFNYLYYTKFIFVTGFVLLLFCLIMILSQTSQYFLDFKLQAYLVVVGATISAFVLGILCAGKNVSRQIALGMETGLRNPGLAYVIASENFLQTKVIAIIIPYIVTMVLTVFFCNLLLRLVERCRKRAYVSK